MGFVNAALDAFFSIRYFAVSQRFKLPARIQIYIKAEAVLSRYLGVQVMISEAGYLSTAQQGCFCLFEIHQ